MMINTIDELKQRIGKLVILSPYSEDFSDYCTSMFQLIKIEKQKYQTTETNLYGWNIYGKFSAYLNPMFLQNHRQIAYSNNYKYARDPTEQEIKMFMHNWRLLLFSEKVKTNIKSLI